jgi:hypothetical protein
MAANISLGSMGSMGTKLAPMSMPDPAVPRPQGQENSLLSLDTLPPYIFILKGFSPHSPHSPRPR